MNPVHNFIPPVFCSVKRIGDMQFCLCVMRYIKMFHYYYYLLAIEAVEKYTLFSKFRQFWYPFHCTRVHRPSVKNDPFYAFFVWAWCPPFNGSCPPPPGAVVHMHVIYINNNKKKLIVSRHVQQFLKSNLHNFKQWLWYWCTVRPRLSGHIGTSTYPDKWFGQIWEIRLNTASSIGLNTYLIIYLLNATLFVTNYHSCRMDYTIK